MLDISAPIKDGVTHNLHISFSQVEYSYSPKSLITQTSLYHSPGHQIEIWIDTYSVDSEGWCTAVGVGAQVDLPESHTDQHTLKRQHSIHTETRERIS